MKFFLSFAFWSLCYNSRCRFSINPSLAFFLQQLFPFPFNDSFPFSSFSHFSLAFSLQQFFSLPKASHTKKPKVNPQKVLLLGSLIAASRVEPQAGAWHCNRRNLHSCFSEHNLGDAAVLSFPCFIAKGCAYLCLQVKAINCISPCLCPVS
jgi:hypothetical protein